MKITVLVKQVPNTTQVAVDPVTNNLVREGVPSIVNPFDLFAVEEALRLKMRFGGSVTVVSMGPPQAEEVIRFALAMGADRGVLVTDRAFAGSDTLATSYTIGAALAKLGETDLILTGKQAADGDTGQVPAELARQLGIGCLTYVTKIQDITKDSLTAVRDLGMAKVKAWTALPAVLSLERGLNDPRFPRVCDMVRAAEAEVLVLHAEDIQPDPFRISSEGSPTQVIRIFSPDKQKHGMLLKGDAFKAADKLTELLSERELV